MNLDPRLARIVARHRHPLVFATLSGAHLYGFPSPDSDFDLRGAHVLPLRAVLGLDLHDETIEQSFLEESAPGQPPLEMDIVSHDVRKFFGLLLKKNGYVLEQVLSPLVVHAAPAHDELRALARRCVTRHHSHHYFGFAETQWKLFLKESPRRVKPLLYVYRVLLTGIHLMRTGEVEANLLRLLDDYPLSGVRELVARKLSGPEQSRLADDELAAFQRDYEQLRIRLQSELEQSRLPDLVPAPVRAALDDLLIRLRLSTTASPVPQGP